MDCDCNKCDFWNNELGCTCPDGDRWYAGACATATEEEFRDEDTQKIVIRLRVMQADV